MKRALIYCIGAFTSLAFAQQEQIVIQKGLQDRASSLGLSASDFNGIELTSSASSLAPGAKHVYVRQTFQGIPVLNGVGGVALKDAALVHVSNRFVDLPDAPVALQTNTAYWALEQAGKHLGISALHATVSQEEPAKNASIFNAPELSKKPIPVRLFWMFQNGSLVPVWDMSILVHDNSHWWSIRVHAQTGEILFQNDWMSQCQFEACESATAHTHHQTSRLMPPPPGADQYMVYALPVISPSHGNRSLVINPSDPTYSPYGWHDTDGVMGDEYTITFGNNVYASEDIDNDDIPGYSPDGGLNLNFDFAYDSLVGVQGNLDAVITNLFYMNNMMHDIWAYYGFDELSGNFQETNYTGNGQGMDQVYADAQDGSGTNNANFGTPPDGQNPRMQMYLWTSSNVPDLLTINAPAALAGSYAASTAGFGPPVPSIPITEDLVLVLDDGTDTTDGCGVISNGAALNGKIALVRRGNCTFVQKVEACQAEGAIAVIVMNNQGGTPISMGGTSAIVTIPSIMVSQANGNSFVASMNAGNTVNGTIVNPGDLTATDSDFDNMIIAHEYGHGISNRLVGGPDNVDCLYNAEQMGEGWSDWFGLMLTMLPGDQPEDPRGVGTYVTNEPNNGTGIRPAPYSTDPALNDYTYGNTNSNNLSQPHGIGFVWASMLWDLNWALIDSMGFDPNMKTGTGGNNIAMALVTEGLKLTACGPGFVDGRDAILQADQLLYGGDFQCLIWEVFANRGLGYSADQGNPDDRNDQAEAFDMPPVCLSAGINEKSFPARVYPNPTQNVVNIDLQAAGQLKQLRVVDVTGKVILSVEHPENEMLHLTTTNWSRGVYMLVLETAEGVATTRIVKQ